MNREGEKSLIAEICVVAALILAALVFSMGYKIGRDHGENATQTEAARNNVGEWIPDVNGVATFKWKHLKVGDYLEASDATGFHNPATAEDYTHMHDYLQPKEKTANGK